MCLPLFIRRAYKYCIHTSTNTYHFYYENNGYLLAEFLIFLISRYGDDRYRSRDPYDGYRATSYLYGRPSTAPISNTTQKPMTDNTESPSSNSSGWKYQVMDITRVLLSMYLTSTAIFIPRKNNDTNIYCSSVMFPKVKTFYFSMSFFNIIRWYELFPFILNQM